MRIKTEADNLVDILSKVKYKSCMTTKTSKESFMYIITFLSCTDRYIKTKVAWYNFGIGLIRQLENVKKIIHVIKIFLLKFISKYRYRVALWRFCTVPTSTLK